MEKIIRNFSRNVCNSCRYGHVPFHIQALNMMFWSVLMGWFSNATFEKTVCFSLIRYAQVCHTGCLVLSSFLRPRWEGVHQGGYQLKNHHSSSRLHQGEGAYDPACITVAVGNHIHQIKSSIYLCGSGDSGEGGGGWWEGWPRGEIVTVTLWRGVVKVRGREG